jgi:hypothetical protein
MNVVHRLLANDASTMIATILAVATIAVAVIPAVAAEAGDAHHPRTDLHAVAFLAKKS